MVVVVVINRGLFGQLDFYCSLIFKDVNEAMRMSNFSFECIEKIVARSSANHFRIESKNGSSWLSATLQFES